MQTCKEMPRDADLYETTMVRKDDGGAAGGSAPMVIAARRRFIVLLAQELLMGTGPVWPQTRPPRARREPVALTRHGVSWSDDFAWLKADNWQEVLKEPGALPADIRAYLDAENRHAARLMRPQRTLMATLVKEMRGRIAEADSDVPVEDGPHAYYRRFRRGGNHPLVCRMPRGGGTETVLLDAEALAHDHAFFALKASRQSPDHRLLGWGADTNGSEYCTLTVRDLATGSDIDSVADTTGRLVWLADSSGFLYVRLDDKHRDNRVFLHRIGQPQTADILLHEETEPGMFIALGQTQDSAFITLTIGDHETSEVRLVDPANPAATPRIVAPRQTGIQYDLDHHQGRFIILTNADSATDFKIVTAPVATPGRDTWVDLVPHEDGRLIEDFACFAGHLVWQERRDAVPALMIRRWRDGESHAIGFDEPSYALSFSAGDEFDTTRLRFTYSSLTTPQETYDYDMETHDRVLRKRRTLPSGHNPGDYLLRRIEAKTDDGALVPVSLLMRKGQRRDGLAPCLLYGYGAYGITMSAGFRSNILSLVDRGFVFAIAHIRGGKDKGYRWYETGKRADKVNSFTDFIAAAEALVATGHTRAGRIVAHGGSAGGLLMGAVANMRPDLFAGIIAQVPFVDTLNTMLDKDLPLTPPEWPEWGNPIESAADFATIRAYSPYDNIKPQAYPAMLVEGGLTDPRVTYWEPAKWVAKLRATMTGGGPIAFFTNMEAGHGGISGRLKRLSEDARVYAFALAAIQAARAVPTRMVPTGLPVRRASPRRR